MHYITGTSFTVTSNAKSNLSPDRRFKIGFTYTLLRILKKDQNMFYTFACVNDGSRVEIEFSTCYDADKVIAKLRKEILPNYYTLESDLNDQL